MRFLIKPSELVRQLEQMVFSILLVGHKKCDPAWEKHQRRNPFYTLWFISKGTGDFIIDGAHYTAEPGKLFVFVPGMVCERKSSKGDPLEFYFIRFSYAMAYHEKEQWHFNEVVNTRFPLNGTYTIQNSPRVINILEQILHLWKRRGPMVVMRRKILFYELLLTIVQDFRAQKVTGNTTMAIERTIHYMVSNYKDKVSVEDLAKMAGLSTSHYSRLFKKYIGHTPIDYLNHLRMDRAKELLVLSDYRLKSIAQSVGYQDEFYFSRLFKKIIGLSPTEYAQRHKTLPTSAE
jgi:AraC-like DNA-binding protein